MTRINDLYNELCRLAPLELQMDFDNSGFQIGRGDRELHRVLLSLDVTDEVAAEAAARGAELIVSHHPLIFTPLNSVTDRDAVQRRVMALIENRIALISMHTNLDVAEGGVNDVLIRLLGAEAAEPLDVDGCGRIGCLPAPVPLETFLSICNKQLKCRGLRYISAGKAVHKLAVMGGAGGGSLEEAAARGCDTYVTADIKYHQFQRAGELGINLIDADHFYTENPVILDLTDKLRLRFPDVEFMISAAHDACISFA